MTKMFIVIPIELIVYTIGLANGEGGVVRLPHLSRMDSSKFSLNKIKNLKNTLENGRNNCGVKAILYLPNYKDIDSNAIL